MRRKVRRRNHALQVDVHQRMHTLDRQRWTALIIIRLLLEEVCAFRDPSVRKDKVQTLRLRVHGFEDGGQTRFVRDVALVERGAERGRD